VEFDYVVPFCESHRLWGEPHYKTLKVWSDFGLIGADGQRHKLESFLVGNMRCTTLHKYKAFLEAVNAPRKIADLLHEKEVPIRVALRACVGMRYPRELFGRYIQRDGSCHGLEAYWVGRRLFTTKEAIQRFQQRIDSGMQWRERIMDCTPRRRMVG
jgi:hypothetical protein